MEKRTPNPVGWRGTPLTVGLAVVAIGGAVWLAERTLGAKDALNQTAEVAAVKAVKLHSTPPVRQVHPDAVDTQTLGEAVHRLETVRDSKMHLMDRKLDRIDSKLDALVQPAPPRAGRAYTRRRTPR